MRCTDSNYKKKNFIHLNGCRQMQIINIRSTINYQTPFTAKKLYNAINYYAEGLKLKSRDGNWQKK